MHTDLIPDFENGLSVSSVKTAILSKMNYYRVTGILRTAITSTVVWINYLHLAIWISLKNVTSYFIDMPLRVK